MKSPRVRLQDPPRLVDGRMVLGLSGWMDGGSVSLGTVEWLVRTLGARPLADIRGEGFYIANFPGSMELSALLRPATKIEDGLVVSYEPPQSEFWVAEAEGVVLFSGREPNFGWADFAECIFEVAAATGVRTLYFIGSVGGTVPHTREPRLFSTVSSPELKTRLAPYGVRFTNYEGPASFSTLLLHEAPRRGVDMASLVAEIPAYIQGMNPPCIAAMLRKVAAILGIQVGLAELDALGTTFEKRLAKLLARKTDLKEHIHKLEEDYDNDVFDTQMGDLKDWLEQQGVRVD